MKNNIILSSSPHLHTRESVRKIMWAVVLSLLPAGAAGVYLFGISAFWILAAGIVSALVTEGVIQALSRKKISLSDGSAFLTGLLLAYNLPPDIPLWLPVLGSFFAVAVGKQIFGGLGQNIFNPALVGRVFLMASWPKYMTTFTKPLAYDAITQATPLALLKEHKLMEHISYLDLFLGKRGGCIGEVCIAVLVAGALFLLIKGYISWHIPFSYIFTVGLLTYVFGPNGIASGDWLFHILSGGLILGAFFMATDYVSSPLTHRGQLIFGMGCGFITAVIRLWGGYPEGVSYAILIMNAATPIIDRYTKNRIYGV
ncbi:MAG: RnfABCDGE type electron transport complex subunit D [Candidatus Omnitrophota bacterium]|jgi:electron transport complex protein RnfD|nr:MAG: RnfABCDGE type electron transport complex subunit D [Candidatus Omnitrophota bacterium]